MWLPAEGADGWEMTLCGRGRCEANNPLQKGEGMHGQIFLIHIFILSPTRCLLALQAEGTAKDDIPPWEGADEASGSDSDDENNPPAKQCVGLVACLLGLRPAIGRMAGEDWLLQNWLVLLLLLTQHSPACLQAAARLAQQQRQPRGGRRRRGRQRAAAQPAPAAA